MERKAIAVLHTLTVTLIAQAYKTPILLPVLQDYVEQVRRQKRSVIYCSDGYAGHPANPPDPGRIGKHFAVAMKVKSTAWEESISEAQGNARSFITPH